MVVRDKRYAVRCRGRSVRLTERGSAGCRAETPRPAFGAGREVAAFALERGQPRRRAPRPPARAGTEGAGLLSLSPAARGRAASPFAEGNGWGWRLQIRRPYRSVGGAPGAGPGPACCALPGRRGRRQAPYELRC